MEALAKSGKVGLVRKEDAEAAQHLQSSIETLRQTSESFGRAILTKVTPVIVDLIERFQRWIETNKDWIQSDIIAKVEEFAKALRELPWDEIGKGIRDFVVGCNDAAKSVGGWKVVVEGLFVLWTGAQFMKVLRAIGLLKLALTGGKLSGGLISALGVLGTAGIAGILATSAATDAAVPNAEKPGVITRSDDENTGGADAVGMWGAVKRGARGLYRRGRRMFGGGDADAAEGGGGIRTRARRAARGDQSGGVAANPGAYKDVLDHIARSEGTAHQPGGGYNTSLANGLLLPGGKEQDLTKLTLDQIDALQTGMLRHPANRWNSSAIGRYQIVRTTLRAQREKLGLKGSDLFDEKTQDRIATNLARQRGADPVGLRQEWASLVGAKNATAVALMQKVDPKASTMPLDRPQTPAPAPQAAVVPFTRRSEVLADPKDERRKPAAAPKPAPVPSAWNGIPAAAAAVAQVQAAQAARIASITNDNRQSSTRTDTTHMHGDVIVNSNASNANDLIGDLKASLKGRAYAMASNSGQA